MSNGYNLLMPCDRMILIGLLMRRKPLPKLRMSRIFLPCMRYCKTMTFSYVKQLPAHLHDSKVRVPYRCSSKHSHGASKTGMITMA